MINNSAIDSDYYELDQELAALQWFADADDQLSFRIPVKEITERALHEYSLRLLGDFAFEGMGNTIAELSSIVFGGKPLPSHENYRI